MINTIICGDCLEVMKDIEANSIDAVVTDPPYGLSFMGKKWDYDVPSVEIWKECLRVLKPGGYLLAFAGTRTQHKIASGIEDAGFEIRDMIAWVYGSGFPKSLNVGKSVNQLETNEWLKIGKALDNIDQKSIIEVWNTSSNNVKLVETQSLKNQTTVGQDTPSENFAVLNVVQNNNQENSDLLVSFVEKNLNEAQAIKTKINTVLQNVEAEIKQSLNLVKSAEQLSRNQNLKPLNIFTAQCDVKEWLKENTMVNHRVDEALKTLRGNKKYSNEEITNVLCAVLTENLKLTILNQSKTFQSLDTNSQMECLSAINVIITEYIGEHLISNTVNILKSKAVDKLQGNEREVIGLLKNPATPKEGTFNCSFNEQKLETKGASEWEGWGTALKPALEPITVARKPLSEKTVAENVLKWGTGGINIDGSRVEYQGEADWNNTFRPSENIDKNCWIRESNSVARKDIINKSGRFPANLIHDGSDEVVSLFPNSISRIGKPRQVKNIGSFGGGTTNENNEYNDSGSASRFFYCAKASKTERNMGCDGLEEKQQDESRKEGNPGGDNPRNRGVHKRQNNHPTVKPIALMEYLVKLVSREGATILDPFAGSGSTLIACKNLNRNFIGIELNPEYCKIAQERIKNIPPKLF